MPLTDSIRIDHLNTWEQEDSNFICHYLDPRVPLPYITDKHHCKWVCWCAVVSRRKRNKWVGVGKWWPVTFVLWTQISSRNKPRCLPVHLPVFTELLFFAKQQHLGRGGEVGERGGGIQRSITCLMPLRGGLWVSSSGTLPLLVVNCQEKSETSLWALTFSCIPWNYTLSPKRFAIHTVREQPAPQIWGLPRRATQRKDGWVREKATPSRSFPLRRSHHAQDLWYLCEQRKDTDITVHQASQIILLFFKW